MNDCVYCSKLCKADQLLYTNDQHTICIEEKQRRYKDRVCVRCGSKQGNCVQCDACKKLSNPPYLGY